MTEKQIKTKWNEILLDAEIEECAFVAGYAVTRLMQAGKIKKETYKKILEDLDNC